MLSVTSAQLDAWLAAFIYPLVRLLALFATAPIFSNRAVSVRIRMGAALAIAMAVLPALPQTPPIPIESGIGLAVLVQQMLIGIAIGFMMRLVFAAVDVAGEMIGLQMGLSFAVFFDPDAGGQTSVLAEFLGLLTTVIFLALDGHLMLVKVLVTSFEWLPIGQTSLAGNGWTVIVRYAATVFAGGLMLAMPLVAALLIVNISLGVLTRAAPQLNLFAVGFPVTLASGFLVLLLTLNAFAPVMRNFFERGFEATAQLLRALGG